MNDPDSTRLEGEPDDHHEADDPELAADVRRHLATEPILARPPSTLYRFFKYARRHRVRMVALAAAVVISCGFIVAGWLRAIHRVQELLEEGRAQVDDYSRARRDNEAYDRWIATRDRYDKLAPVWERQDEIAARDAWEAHLRELNQSYERARGLLTSALELVPWPSGIDRPIKESLERLDVELLRRVREQGAVRLTEADVVERIHALNVGRFTAEVEAGGRIELTTRPAGVTVRCFRYDAHDEVLVPIAFRPSIGTGASGVIGRPFLRVERVLERDRSPFRSGDRVLEVAGREARTRTELARALRDVVGRQSVAVSVERDGAEIEVRWMPYPTKSPDEPGRLDRTIRESFYFFFEGYPLDLSQETVVGVSGEEPLSFDLPGGSYLLVLEKPGYVTTRYPVSMPDDRGAHDVRLLRPDEVPEGFVHVPAGRYSQGGDDLAYRSEPRNREGHVDGFLMARFEVTLGDYMRFLNQTSLPLVRNASGKVTQKCRIADLTALEDVERLSAAMRALFGDADLEGDPDASTVNIVPIVADQRGRPRWVFKRAVGKWTLNHDDLSSLRESWPVRGVSLVAALEYCRWLKELHGGRWSFRLPRSHEWEKAARGVDGRPFVWGEHFYGTFCTFRTGEEVEYFPLDESVYGVRGLTGSVSEHIGERVPSEDNLFLVRGGNYNVADERDFRAASRDQSLPYQQWEHIGFRVVADLPKERE